MVAPPKEHEISISPKIDPDLKESCDISEFLFQVTTLEELRENTGRTTNEKTIRNTTEKLTKEIYIAERNKLKSWD